MPPAAAPSAFALVATGVAILVGLVGLLSVFVRLGGILERVRRLEEDAKGFLQRPLYLSEQQGLINQVTTAAKALEKIAEKMEEREEKMDARFEKLEARIDKRLESSEKLATALADAARSLADIAHRSGR